MLCLLEWGYLMAITVTCDICHESCNQFAVYVVNISKKEISNDSDKFILAYPSNHYFGDFYSGNYHICENCVHDLIRYIENSVISCKENNK